MRKRRPVSKQTLRERLLKKLWKLFSIYVRQKSKGVCYICGAKKDWRELDASHYIHGRLDFSEINIQACCRKCNRFMHGNLGRYAERLITDYGRERLVELRQEAAQVKKWEPEELQEKITYYTQAIKKLN